jgi:hypothetical protein
MDTSCNKCCTNLIYTNTHTNTQVYEMGKAFYTLKCTKLKKKKTCNCSTALL